MSARTPDQPHLALLRNAIQRRRAQAHFWTMHAEFEEEKAARFAAQQSAIHSRMLFRFLANPISVLRLTPGLLTFLGVTSAAAHALYDKAGGHSRERHADDWPDVYNQMTTAHLSHVPTRLAEFVARRHSGVELVFATRDGRHIFLPIKFISAVDAKSRVDECWVKTMFFMRAEGVQTKVDSRQIRPITHNERGQI